jgi:phage shock protein PspC (stress-responsive transcriptional regulator)
MSAPKRLFRHSGLGKIGGVCAGIADYLDSDVTLVRLLWIVLSIVPGGLVGGLVAYVAAWIIMPDAAAAEPAAAPRRLTRSTVDRKIGGVCGGLAEYLSADPTAVRVAWVILTIVPGMILFGVAAYIVAWFIMPLAPVPHAAATPSVA